MNAKEFMHKVDLIPVHENHIQDSIWEYLWDNLNDFESNEKIFIYTYIEDFEDGDYISEGIHWANRLGYFLARNYVELEDGILRL